MKVTSMKVPMILSERFDNCKQKKEAWEGYRSFSEFGINAIRKAIVDYELEIKKREELLIAKSQ